jgi:hypothetical protein
VSGCPGRGPGGEFAGRGERARSTPPVTALGKQFVQPARVLAIGLGAPHAPAQRARLDRLSQMRKRAGGHQRDGHKSQPVHASTATSIRWPAKRPVQRATAVGVRDKSDLRSIHVNPATIAISAFSSSGTCHRARVSRAERRRPPTHAIVARPARAAQPLVAENRVPKGVPDSVDLPRNSRSRRSAIRLYVDKVPGKRPLLIRRSQVRILPGALHVADRWKSHVLFGIASRFRTRCTAGGRR